MKDWVRLLDASYEAHICKLDHKDCKVLADDIRALLREEETARKEIAELKEARDYLRVCNDGNLNAAHALKKEIAELKAEILLLRANVPDDVERDIDIIIKESKETEKGQKGGNER